jgi:hypothetical protein
LGSNTRTITARMLLHEYLLSVVIFTMWYSYSLCHHLFAAARRRS